MHCVLLYIEMIACMRLIRGIFTAVYELIVLATCIAKRQLDS